MATPVEKSRWVVWFVMQVGALMSMLLMLPLSRVLWWLP